MPSYGWIVGIGAIAIVVIVFLGFVGWQLAKGVLVGWGDGPFVEELDEFGQAVLREDGC